MCSSDLPYDEYYPYGGGYADDDYGGGYADDGDYGAYPDEGYGDQGYADEADSGYDQGQGCPCSCSNDNAYGDGQDCGD